MRSAPDHGIVTDALMSAMRGKLPRPARELVRVDYVTESTLDVCHTFGDLLTATILTKEKLDEHDHG